MFRKSLDIYREKETKKRFFFVLNWGPKNNNEKKKLK